MHKHGLGYTSKPQASEEEIVTLALLNTDFDINQKFNIETCTLHNNHALALNKNCTLLDYVLKLHPLAFRPVKNWGSWSQKQKNEFTEKIKEEMITYNGMLRVLLKNKKAAAKPSETTLNLLKKELDIWKKRDVKKIIEYINETETIIKNATERRNSLFKLCLFKVKNNPEECRLAHNKRLGTRVKKVSDILPLDIRKLLNN